MENQRFLIIKSTTNGQLSMEMLVYCLANLLDNLLAFYTKEIL